MKTWFVLNLGDAMLAGDAFDTACQVFRQHYDNAGQPPSMGLFQRHESPGRLHCELRLYFTPAAAHAAREAGATPCVAPVRTGLGLSAGSPQAWSLLDVPVQD